MVMTLLYAFCAILNSISLFFIVKTIKRDRSIPILALGVGILFTEALWITMTAMEFLKTANIIII